MVSIATDAVEAAPAASVARNSTFARPEFVSAGVHSNSPVAALKLDPAGNLLAETGSAKPCQSTATARNATREPARARRVPGNSSRGAAEASTASEVCARPSAEAASMVTFSCRAPGSARTSNFMLRRPVAGRITAGTRRLSELEEIAISAACESELPS